MGLPFSGNVIWARFRAASTHPVAMSSPSAVCAFTTCDANETVASVAYRLNELIAIYPHHALADHGGGLR